MSSPSLVLVAAVAAVTVVSASIQSCSCTQTDAAWIELESDPATEDDELATAKLKCPTCCLTHMALQAPQGSFTGFSRKFDKLHKEVSPSSTVS